MQIHFLPFCHCHDCGLCKGNFTSTSRETVNKSGLCQINRNCRPISIFKNLALGTSTNCNETICYNKTASGAINRYLEYIWLLCDIYAMICDINCGYIGHIGKAGKLFCFQTWSRYEPNCAPCEPGYFTGFEIC